MAEINHEIKIDAPVDKVYTALSTLEGLRSWHTANIAGKMELNDVIAIQAADKPLFEWKIIEAIPSSKVTWECLAGPGDSKGTKVFYKLSKTDDNRTLLELSHTEWPHQAVNYRKCNTLWGVLLHHLKQYVETDKPQSAFQS
jgi:uncharacterized protein YndB with AHSA1/START domain